MATKQVTRHKPGRMSLALGYLSEPERDDTVHSRTDDTRILAEEMAGEYGRSRAYWLGLVTGGGQ